MRKRLIKKLDFKERQWLYKAVISMIIADKTVATEEVDDLKDTLKMVAGKELKEIGDYINSKDFLDPMQPLHNIDFENAFIILTEIARVAAIDSKIVLEEEALLQEILSLLDFREDDIERVMAWTKKLALINKEEDDLKNELCIGYRQ